MRHGDKSPFGNTLIKLTEINEQLSKPFHLLYSGSKVCLLKFKWKGHLNHIEFHLQQKVEAAAFPDDKEPLWSTNFKRSISSILQVDLSGINNYVYSDKEVFCLLPTYYYKTSLYLFSLKFSFSVISEWEMRSQLLLFAFGWEPTQCDKASRLGFVPRATGSMEDFYRYALMSRRRTAGIMN